MFLRILLFPFSLLYGIITFVRNKLYDWKCIPSVRYDDIFVISVGNITVGGTGKTPFVEYLIRLLSLNYQVAVLSRGYKRTTKGFRFVEKNTIPSEVGDEPYQMKQKFPGIIMAVDTDRVEGIANIRKEHSEIQVILLDDAFQYRKIRPNWSIILTDYNRPMYRDGMLPGGRLREWVCFSKRANLMIITKSPAEISTKEQYRISLRHARFFQHIILYTTIGYDEPLPVFSNGQPLSTNDLKQHDVLLVTGIANPKPFEVYIRQHAASVQTVTFPDHHAFSDQDIKNITEQWDNISSANKILITTEKDAVRLQQLPVSGLMVENSYYVPIMVNFISNGEKAFKHILTVNLRTCIQESIYPL